MKLITSIKVEGFRSIVDDSATPLGDFTCLVGTNNSGKSNILRALNLFFTGEPEPGSPLEFARDYHANPRSKKKKQIRISISFDLPYYFKFREGLEDTEKKLGKQFTIRKTWTLFQPEPEYEVAGSDNDFKKIDAATVKQFTDLINFRYIQNRTVPAQALRAESSAFQAHINRRLSKQQKNDATTLLRNVRAIASEAVSEANENLAISTDSMNKLEMSTPLNIASLAEVSGFGAEIRTGARVSDMLWGSGTQAYMMFQLLKIVDTDYRRHFGWRQAAIWAIEEPESSLHKDLEQRLAIILREWSDNQDLRLQVLGTTHSEICVTAASEAFLIELDKEGRTTIKHEPIPILAYDAAAMGISRPVEPVLCFLLNPVVLVEGPIDARILTHVAQNTGVATHCKFVSLPEMDPMQSGGADEVVRYLKRYKWLIQNRPPIAPFMALFDWEISDQLLLKARDNYGEYADIRVNRMDPSHADPKVSPDIPGIERFYPIELFQAARDKNRVDVAIDQYGNVSIDKSKLKKAKSTLANMLCKAPDASWYGHLKKVLEDVQTKSLIVFGSQIGLHS
jgi:energy-coupling factor transporter ATP-binding protein EcfA2